MRLAEIKQCTTSTPVILFACAFLLATIFAGLSDVLNAPASITSALPTSQHWMRQVIDALFVLLAGICATYLVAKLVLKRANTEDALQIEKNKLQSMIDAMEDHLTIRDTDYNLVYQSEPAKQLFGDHLGEKCYRVYEGKDKICDGCPAEKAFKDGKSHTAERKLVMPSGEVTFWENTANPIRDAGGNIVACLEIARNITERKQTEEALQTEKNKLQSVIDAMADGLSIQDKDFNIIYQNEPSRIGAGRDCLGEKCYQAYEGRKTVCDGCPIEQAFKDGKSHTAERRRVSPSGEVNFWENTVSPIRDASGKIVSCLEITRNITERKRAEEAQADEAIRRRILVDQSRDGIVILDQNGKVYEANRQFAEMLGYTHEEAAELHAWDWDTQWTREQLLGMVQSVDAAGDHFETYHRRKDGTTIDVEISTNGAVCAGQKLVFCVCRDITKRKQMEKALQDSEEKLRKMFESVTDGISVIDLNGVITETNQRTVEIHGFASRDELVGKNAFELVAPRDHKRIAGNMRQALKQGTINGVEYTLLKPDGTEFPGELSTSVLKDAAGKVIGHITIVRDITERKRAEEALRESEEFRSSLLANSPNPIGVINPDSSIRYVNPALEKLTGFSAAELIGKKAPYPYWTQATLKKTIMGFRKAMRQGDLRAEELFQKKNGELFWVKITSTPVMNNGDFKYLLTNWVDITKRKQVEEALRQSEKKYKNLAEATSDLIWEADERGTFTFVGPRIKDILGYETNEVIGKMRTLNLTTKAEARKWLKLFKEINAKKEPFSGFEITHLHKNGTPVLFEISGIPTFDSDGNFKGYVGVNKNITERKQAEEKIRSAAEEWRTTFDSITDFISIHDKDNRIVRVNKAFADAFKTTPDKLVGKLCHQLSHGTKEPPENCPHRQTLKTGKPATMEVFDPNRGIYTQESTSPIFDAKGNVAGSVHIAKNITERKRMEEQLMLTDRLASIGELASGIAHELNNPLTSVIGFSQLLLEEDIPENLKEDLGTIYSEAQRASAIVKNLLTFARKHAPMRQLSQVNSILEDVLKLRSYEHKVNNIELEKNFAPELPEIMVDYFQMQQVFLNIIVNAETAMLEANGRGKLVISTGRVNNTVKVTIADSGPGIAKENLRRVFDPFFTTKEVGKGTGLGLSICHGIITGHGGKIYAEGEIKKGASFVVELPLNGN